MEQEFFDLQAVPEPWAYNPSKWSQRVVICFVALPAFLIAAYMGFYQWRLIPGVWDPVFGDQTVKVLDSDVSHQISSWVLMPDSILGTLAYLGDILFALAGSTRRWQDRPWLVMIFGIDVIPLGIVSATLIAMQGLVVGSWCFLCMITAVISIVLVFLAYDEVWSSFLYVWKVWKRTGDKKLTWNTFWGRPSEIALQIGTEMVRARTPKRRS